MRYCETSKKQQNNNSFTLSPPLITYFSNFVAGDVTLEVYLSELCITMISNGKYSVLSVALKIMVNNGKKGIKNIREIIAKFFLLYILAVIAESDLKKAVSGGVTVITTSKLY